MYNTYNYKYAPLLIGAEKLYSIELPVGASPVVYKTMTTNMRHWDGELLQSQHGQATALVRVGNRLVPVKGELVGPVVVGNPCIVMEHLNIDGEMEIMIGNKNILNGNQNFVNFGIPNGKHVRIDIYTGESRVIE